ncbi:hypothetical protein ABT086_00205 [Streptomyces mirabilis]
MVREQGPDHDLERCDVGPSLGQFGDQFVALVLRDERRLTVGDLINGDRQQAARLEEGSAPIQEV